MEISKVYFTKEITPSSLIKMYNVMGRKLSGNIGVKVHSGEKGNQNFLKPEFYKEIINYTNGTIIECNTAYAGERNTSEKHLKLISEHGWDKYFKVDLMDRDGEIKLPVNNGKVLKENYVGKNFANYDSILVVSHFKGHPMGGFGGALKNISIGIASSNGKAYIHGAGIPENIWTADQNLFLESMADASKSVMEYKKDKIVFINVMANLSVDCDCCSDAEDPCMKDIGILSSLDPVALDKACMDLIYESEDPGKVHFIERVESRNGMHTINTAYEIGVGNKEYDLINVQ